MARLLEARIERLLAHLSSRLGQDVVYRTFISTSYDPKSGSTPNFQETEITAIPVSLNDKLLAFAGGALTASDRVLAIRAADLPAPPKYGDEVKIGEEIWTLDLGNKKTFFFSDPTKTVYFIGLRRRV